MKKLFLLFIFFFTFTLLLPAERQVLHMVAKVPVKTYVDYDTFTVLNDKCIGLEVIGAKEIGDHLYQAERDSVTLKLTNID